MLQYMDMKKVFYYFAVFVLLWVSVSIPLVTFAQVETTLEKESRLRAELAQVEKEQAETEKVLASAKNQSASISRDILILDTKIKAALLNIKAKNILIQTLGKDITEKQVKIQTLESHISRGVDTLEQIMRKNNELESVSFPEFLLSKASISEAFIDVDNFESVQESLHTTFKLLRENKAQTEVEKSSLNTKKNREQDALATIETEKKNIEGNQKEKQRLLSISKSNEAAYSQELAQKKAKAAQIRAALFSLRDTAAIPFADALKFAQEANKATGIRPAFLLAILTQESALGKNVGTCYLTDPNTGAGISTKSGNTFPNVMKPTRDVQPFIEITKSLGLDYTKTLVSCPQSVGWGGAMGPAQFIASTWVLFKSQISAVIGGGVPNPWNPEHAFIASALYLTEIGAGSQTYTAERNAACRYYSGKVCTVGNINMTYGTQVMAKADNIQRTMIDPLQGL